MTTATRASISRVAEAAWGYRKDKEGSYQIAKFSEENLEPCPDCGNAKNRRAARCRRCYKKMKGMI